MFRRIDSHQEKLDLPVADHKPQQVLGSGALLDELEQLVRARRDELKGRTAK